ncbi:hypothetical protein XENTR_v10013978 [Xenopus tropicalis]|nr:hypothetical protein XENTR_v10013978 [Xenopus tropicalis]
MDQDNSQNLCKSECIKTYSEKQKQETAAILSKSCADYKIVHLPRKIEEHQLHPSDSGSQDSRMCNFFNSTTCKVLFCMFIALLLMLGLHKMLAPNTKAGALTPSEKMIRRLHQDQKTLNALEKLYQDTVELQESLAKEKAEFDKLHKAQSEKFNSWQTQKNIASSLKMAA